MFTKKKERLCPCHLPQDTTKNVAAEVHTFLPKSMCIARCLLDPVFFSYTFFLQSPSHSPPRPQRDSSLCHLIFTYIFIVFPSFTTGKHLFFVQHKRQYTQTHKPAWLLLLLMEVMGVKQEKGGALLLLIQPAAITLWPSHQSTLMR